jgi:hypothetical protein
MHFPDPTQTQPLPPPTGARRPAAGNGPPSAPSRQAIQADFAAWQAGLERWKGDTARWQADHDALLKRLADMQRAVVEHGHSLAAHEALFPGIAQALAELGSLLAVTPAEAGPGDAASVARRHAELAARVQCCEDAHHRMARHHADVLSHMADLERATSSSL